MFVVNTCYWCYIMCPVPEMGRKRGRTPILRHTVHIDIIAIILHYHTMHTHAIIRRRLNGHVYNNLIVFIRIKQSHDFIVVGLIDSSLIFILYYYKTMCASHPSSRLHLVALAPVHKSCIVQSFSESSAETEWSAYTTQLGRRWTMLFGVQRQCTYKRRIGINSSRKL